MLMSHSSRKNNPKNYKDEAPEDGRAPEQAIARIIQYLRVATAKWILPQKNKNEPKRGKMLSVASPAVKNKHKSIKTEHTDQSTLSRSKLGAINQRQKTPPMTGLQDTQVRVAVCLWKPR